MINIMPEGEKEQAPYLCKNVCRAGVGGVRKGELWICAEKQCLVCVQCYHAPHTLREHKLVSSDVWSTIYEKTPNHLGTLQP